MEDNYKKIVRSKYSFSPGSAVKHKCVVAVYLTAV